MTQDPLADVMIRRSTPADIDSAWRCLDAVARERRWLTRVAAPPIEEIQNFLRTDGLIQFFAVEKDEVVGWCNLEPRHHEGMRHCAELGIGLLPNYRGRGLGRRVLEETLLAAHEAGLTRIELEVFASNVAAIKLYERLGFVHEGRKRSARILDGRTEDMLCMALVGSSTTATDATAVYVRRIGDGDPPVMSAAFARIGWSKPVSQFAEYLREQAEGRREVLVAVVGSEFAGYVTLTWESRYPPFAADGMIATGRLRRGKSM